MDQNWNLTHAQRETWVARMEVIFSGKSTHLAMAGGDKNFAGYIGDFRSGKHRGLTYFFGTPTRLKRLAKQLGITSASLRAAFEDTRATSRPGLDRLLVPGFEDWGWFPLEEVFQPAVDPPPKTVEFMGRTLAFPVKRATPQRLVESLDANKKGGVFVVRASPGLGQESFIRRAIQLASASFWTHQEGPLRDGRRQLRLVQRGQVLSPAIQEWAARDGHAVLWLVDDRCSVENPLPASTKTGFTVLPGISSVDAAWCKAFLDRIQALAPDRWRKRLREIDSEDYWSEVEHWALPGPHLAGCVLRSLVEDQAVDGPRMLGASFLRRAEANRRVDLAQALVGLSSSLPSMRIALLEGVRGPELAHRLESPLVQEARQVIDGLRLKKAERDALTRILPAVTGERMVQAMRHLGVLGLEDSGRLSGSEFLDQVVVERLIEEPELLRKALLGREASLLAALSRSERGSDALIAGLNSLDDVGLAVALGWTAGLRLWLAGLSVPRDLATRILGFSIHSNDWRTEEQKRLMPSKKDQLPVDERILTPRIQATEIPSIAALAESARCFATLHGQAIHEELEVHCRLVRAVSLGHPKDILHDDLWMWMVTRSDSVPEGWIELRTGSVSGARGMLDLAQGPLAGVLASHASELVPHKPSPHADLWSTAFDRLAQLEPNAAIDVLGSNLGWCIRLASELGPAPSTGSHPRQRDVLLVQHTLKLLVQDARNPRLARHRRHLQSRLKREMKPLHLLLEQGAFPLEALGLPFRTGGGSRVVADLLAWTCEPDQLTALLTTPDGRLSPIWQAALHAGADLPTAVKLYLEVRAGKIDAGPWPTPKGEDAPHIAMYRALLDLLSGDKIAQLPDSPVAGQDSLEPKQASHVYSPGYREFLWRFHESLGDGDVIWELTVGRHLLQVQVDPSIAEPIPEVLVRQLREVDRPYIRNAILHSADAPSDPKAWSWMAGAALAVEVEAPVLIRLIERYGDWGGTRRAEQSGFRHPSLPDGHSLFDLAWAQDPTWTRDWLRAKLASEPSWLDHRPSSRWLVKAELPTEDIEHALGTVSSVGETCGSGLLPGLQRLGGSLSPWLERPETQAAAFDALLDGELDDDELVQSLSGLSGLPPEPVLKRLVRERRGGVIPLLEQACEGWNAPRRRELWRLVGRLARHSGTRDAAWFRASCIA